MAGKYKDKMLMSVPQKQNAYEDGYLTQRAGAHKGNLPAPLGAHVAGTQNGTLLCCLTDSPEVMATVP